MLEDQKRSRNNKVWQRNATMFTVVLQDEYDTLCDSRRDDLHERRDNVAVHRLQGTLANVQSMATVRSPFIAPFVSSYVRPSAGRFHHGLHSSSRLRRCDLRTAGTHLWPVRDSGVPVEKDCARARYHSRLHSATRSYLQVGVHAQSRNSSL